MNFLELCRELILEAGYSGNMTTTENQSGQFARVVKWIKQADMDLQNEHEDWTFLDREFSFQTEGGKSRYTLSDLDFITGSVTSATMDTLTALDSGWMVDQFAGRAVTITSGAGVDQVRTIVSNTEDTLTVSPSWATTPDGGFAISGVQNVGTWDRDKMLITDAYGRSSKLYWADFRMFHHRYGTSMIQAGKPQFFAVLPQGGLALGPTPDAEYAISGWYRLRANPLLADSDVPLVPEPFHQAIVWKALTYYGSNEEAPMIMARGEQLYREMLHKMRLRYLPDIRMPGVLA